MPANNKPPEKKILAPPTFTDGEKRTWTIKLTVDLADRVLEATQFDLIPDDNDISPLTGLLFSTRKLGAVLWECVAEQAASKDIAAKAFRAGLDADAMTAGWGALVDSIIFFTHSKSPELAEALRKSLEGEMRVIAAGARQMVAVIASEETDESVKAAAERIGVEMQSELSAGLAKSVTRSEEF